MLQDAGADYINTQMIGTGTFVQFTYPEQIQYPEPALNLPEISKKIDT
jgi:hypothetical protein